MKILIIDDNEGDITILNRRIELLPSVASGGIRISRVDTASSLTEARALLFKFNYNLIFMDVIMGKDDGILFLKELRDSEVYASQPVVIVSGLGSEIDVIASEKLYATDFLYKSGTMKNLEELLRKYS